MRKIAFANGEYYHIYNRGVDKRAVVSDKYDAQRFLESMTIFNTEDPVGSIYEHSFIDNNDIHVRKPLVSIVCYCLNPNHYHMLVCQRCERGVEKFMHKLSTGYTCYFNQKYKRTGSLFQGPYKAIHIDSNEYLLHLSAYVNLNYKIHQLGGLAAKLVRSSWEEYCGDSKNNFCRKDIILKQFTNSLEYITFAKNSLLDMREHKRLGKELTPFLLD